MCYTGGKGNVFGGKGGMAPYIRKVQYYETDMMGISHHANYIRWMEEARIDFMEQIGHPYAAMEAAGAISPVRAVSCQYKKPSTFGDILEIAVSVEGFNGVVLTLRYDMRNAATGEAVCQARSEHVFMKKGGSILRLKRDLPAFCETIEGLCEAPLGGKTQ